MVVLKVLVVTAKISLQYDITAIFLFILFTNPFNGEIDDYILLFKHVFS